MDYKVSPISSKIIEITILSIEILRTDIAESDLIYTETLMQRTKEDYKDKEILILGGGDGALLFELLKENVKFVTMVEIDDVVLKCCNQFMKSICGSVLEKDSGDNYKVSAKH